MGSWIFERIGKVIERAKDSANTASKSFISNKRNISVVDNRSANTGNSGKKPKIDNLGRVEINVAQLGVDSWNKRGKTANEDFSENSTALVEKKLDINLKIPRTGESSVNENSQSESILNIPQMERQDTLVEEDTKKAEDDLFREFTVGKDRKKTSQKRIMTMRSNRTSIKHHENLSSDGTLPANEPMEKRSVVEDPFSVKGYNPDIDNSSSESGVSTSTTYIFNTGKRLKKRRRSGTTDGTDEIGGEKTSPYVDREQFQKVEQEITTLKKMVYDLYKRNSELVSELSPSFNKRIRTRFPDRLCDSGDSMLMSNEYMPLSTSKDTECIVADSSSDIFSSEKLQLQSPSPLPLKLPSLPLHSLQNTPSSQGDATLVGSSPGTNSTATPSSTFDSPSAEFSETTLQSLVKPTKNEILLSPDALVRSRSSLKRPLSRLGVTEKPKPAPTSYDASRYLTRRNPIMEELLAEMKTHKLKPTKPLGDL